MKSRALIVVVAMLSGAPPALAQDAVRERLALTETAHVVAVDSGGEIILRGAVRSAHDGSVIDALTTRAGATSVEGEGEPVAGGLFDVEAGGWALVSRDPSAHVYRLAATGSPGSACVEAGVRSPCLPLRLLPLAQTRLLAVSDFARTVSGEVTLEVLDPDTVPIAVPPFVVRHGATMGFGALGLVASLLGILTLRRRASTPEATLRRTAARVRARLSSSDPVHRQLAPTIEGLLAHADELTTLRENLRARLAGADLVSLRKRRDELVAKEATGVVEAAKARALVDEQIARVGRWGREIERAAARIAEVREYLEALLQRLDESVGAPASARLESTSEALGELEREVQLAIDCAREADAAARGL